MGRRAGGASMPAAAHAYVVELGIHLSVHLTDDINGGHVVDEEEVDLLQAPHVFHVLALGEHFQEG